MKADPISGDLEAARLRDRVNAMRAALSPERALEIAEFIKDECDRGVSDFVYALADYSKAAEEPE